MKRDQRTLITLVAVLAASAVPVRLRLGAQEQQQPKEEKPRSTPAPAKYNFLIGSGLLCDADVSACPAVAAAANQETIEISGAGTLELPGKSITAAGAFVQKTPEGDIVATGVWTATELVSFESYGVAPSAMLLDHPTLRTPRTFPVNKMPAPLAAMMAGPMAAGGLAVIRIHLLPDAGSSSDAVLQVNCARGKVPEEAQNDGVRLTIAGGPAFDQQVAGRTVFLLPH
jgi:hypothetical protein